MTKPRVGGYFWLGHIADAQRHLRHARGIVEQILDERPGPATCALYIARLLLDLGAVADALDELEAIGGKNTTPES